MMHLEYFRYRYRKCQSVVFYFYGVNESQKKIHKLLTTVVNNEMLVVINVVNLESPVDEQENKEFWDQQMRRKEIIKRKT
jgi:hypothetical protein